MSERDFSNVIVAFDAPEWLIAHPDATVSRDDCDNVTVVSVAGCKSCQRAVSECTCDARMISVVSVYEREIGLNAGLCRILGHCTTNGARSLTSPARPKPTSATSDSAVLTLGDILELLAGSTEHESGKGERETQIINNQGLPPVCAGLIAHINEHRGYTKIYFSYPESKLATVSNLWNRQKRVLDVRPIANPDTDRGGCGCNITMVVPKDLSVLENYPAALKAAEKSRSECTSDGQKILMMKFGDVRLELQLVFQHGFDISGAPWNKAAG